MVYLFVFYFYPCAGIAARTVLVGGKTIEEAYAFLDDRGTYREGDSATGNDVYTSRHVGLTNLPGIQFDSLTQ